MTPMLLTDVAHVDTGATNPALHVLTAPAMGARAPERSRLRAATVTAPITATLPAQDMTWRARATQLAYAQNETCAATWLGYSLRGADTYRVTSGRISARHAYRVSFIPLAGAQTIDDGRYLCECADGRHGVACVHAGAAYLLANRRAIVRESIALAQIERMSWAWATPHGTLDDGLTDLYRVARGQGRIWGYVRVFWDRRNHVALWCDCGAPNGCAHVGSVALRAERERREYLTRCQQTWH